MQFLFLFFFLFCVSEEWGVGCRSSRLFFCLNFVSCFDSHWYSTFNFYKNDFYQAGLFSCKVLFSFLMHLFTVTKKEKIFWKHRPNSPLSVLHQNLFFLTGHENINKPKYGIAIVSLWTHIFTFLWVLSIFLLFLVKIQTGGAMRHNRLWFVKEIQISAISSTGLRTKLHVDDQGLGWGPTYT